jgi:hypothetical protein
VYGPPLAVARFTS